MIKYHVNLQAQGWDIILGLEMLNCLKMLFDNYHKLCSRKCSRNVTKFHGQSTMFEKAGLELNLVNFAHVQWVRVSNIKSVRILKMPKYFSHLGPLAKSDGRHFSGKSGSRGRHHPPVV